MLILVPTGRLGMGDSVEFVFVEEIAQMCRVPASSVRYWLSTGKLASIRPGKRRLVRRDDLMRFLRDAGTEVRRERSAP